MNARDHKRYYETLGVSPDASAKEIKAAYRRKAMDLHPDRNKSPQATERFQTLNVAYGILRNSVKRAQYDAEHEQSGPRSSAAPRPAAQETRNHAPCACSACGKVSAQPRYVVFYEAKSFLFQSWMKTLSGIFCSGCAEKKALRATLVTWLLGWWAFPFGPLFAARAIFTNLFGGTKPAGINAQLAIRQGWAFLAQGKRDLARAIALDALALAERASAARAANMPPGTDRASLRAEVIKLMRATGSNTANNHLKNAWGWFGRPFFIQAVIFCVAVGWSWHFINTLPPSSAPPNGMSAQTAPPPAYVPPVTARPQVPVATQPQAITPPLLNPELNGGHAPATPQLHPAPRSGYEPHCCEPHLRFRL